MVHIGDARIYFLSSYIEKSELALSRIGRPTCDGPSLSARLPASGGAFGLALCIFCKDIKTNARDFYLINYPAASCEEIYDDSILSTISDFVTIQSLWDYMKQVFQFLKSEMTDFNHSLFEEYMMHLV